ncbi:nucleotidyltransferase family protein [Actinidia rufa]|uniref:Nucleotidyltransferase family protein n=1 Tax=Actinidia rufa TaxID=165716 RepID=A0A7J0F576_9ERIC|nr:nucleotidyltransferase family protein [Actinidia rufa]
MFEPSFVPLHNEGFTSLHSAQGQAIILVKGKGNFCLGLGFHLLPSRVLCCGSALSWLRLTLVDPDSASLSLAPHLCLTVDLHPYAISVLARSRAFRASRVWTREMSHLSPKHETTSERSSPPPLSSKASPVVPVSLTALRLLQLSLLPLRSWMGWASLMVSEQGWASLPVCRVSGYCGRGVLECPTLPSYGLYTRDPPILPPFAEILKDGTDPAAVGKIVKEFLDYGKMNKESVGELFITLLIKVEDFTDRSQNVARAVGKKEVTKIYKFINHSILYVFSFMNGQIPETKLRQVLFGRESIPAPTTNFDRGMVDPNISLDPVMTKRMRPTEQAIPFNAIPIKTVYWGGPPTEGWDGTPMESWGGKYGSIHPDKIQPKTMQYAVDWGGIQPTTSSDSIGTNRTQFAEGWGGKNVSCASAELPSVQAQNPIGARKPGDVLLAPLLPPPNQQGFGWPSWNDIVPMPHVGTVYAQHARPSHHQNTGHGPHSNGYRNW